MTPTEKNQKQAELRALMVDHQTKAQMLENELRALEATPVTTYKVWEPKHGEDKWFWYTQDKDRYSVINAGNISISTRLGLIHPTPKAAARHHEFLVMLRQLEAFAVEHNEGWKPDWADGAEKKWGIISGDGLQLGWFVHDKYNILPHFKSKEIAQKAIDTFGDRLKILFEYYNS